MKRHEEDIVDRIDAMSIEQARIEIASGTFGDIGSPNHKFADAWLSAKEKNLQNESEKMVKKSSRSIFALTTAGIWHKIEQEYGLSKRSFGKKSILLKINSKERLYSAM